jgi:hypothetical protein
MLRYANGSVFASGSAPYNYFPQESPRLQIEIEIDSQRLSAAVDIAAPYFIRNLAIARTYILTSPPLISGGERRRLRRRREGHQLLILRIARKAR